MEISHIDQISKVAVRVMSAQRQKNIDLQNRIGELSAQLDALKEENRTLKRVHQREEAALRRFESHDSDVSRLVRNHMEEANALRDTIKSVKAENGRLNKVLIERDEETRALKKKLDEYKRILADKKLLDSAELSRRLEACEKELSVYKTKCESLEKKSEILEKNHKHEIGVEMAHHRETQRVLQKVSEENRELRVRLEEKERALDVANIYTQRVSNHQRGDLSQWKSSTQSLNTYTAESPRDKRKEYSPEKSKRKDSKPPPKPIKEVESNHLQMSPVLLTQQNEDEEEEEAKKVAAAAAAEAELERQRRQQQQQKEEAERKRRERELEAAKIRQQREEEEERERQRRRAEAEEEERRRLEEEDRKKRYISEQTVKKMSENEGVERSASAVRKDQLLAKLSLNNSTANSTSTSQKSSSPPSSSSATPPSTQPVTTMPVRNEIVESLHQGKPVPSSSSSSVAAANPKNDLLNKLFGNASADPKLDNIFAPNQNSSSSTKPALDKLGQFPWEVNSQSRKTSDASNSNMTTTTNGLNRPKVQTSKLLVANQLNSATFEDVEELML